MASLVKSQKNVKRRIKQKTKHLADQILKGQYIIQSIPNDKEMFKNCIFQGEIVQYEDSTTNLDDSETSKIQRADFSSLYILQGPFCEEEYEYEEEQSYE